MLRIAALAFALPVLTLAAQPLAAQEIAYETVAQEPAADGDIVIADTLDFEDAALGGVMPEVVSEVAAEVASDEAVSDDAVPGGGAPEDASPDTGGARLVFAVAPSKPAGVAVYGPFRVIDDRHAALMGVTDTGSPEAFAAMLRDYPGIATLEMISCPGTEDDRANLRLGAMIRAHAISTQVPEHGFVASGAVELFLAGTYRYVDPTAEFAVHSWEDESGREAKDYPLDAPENRAYLDYYQSLGMTAAEARAFYAMTNSVPFAGAKWLTRADIAQWVKLDQPMVDPGAPAPLPALGPARPVLDSAALLQ